MSIDFTSQRLSYEQGELTEQDLPNTPYPLLQTWVEQAVNEKVGEAYAFYLATCGRDNQPSVRTLLMREIVELANDGVGLVFYTNYDSAKGSDIASNPQAEALFFWASLERQVRITGALRKVSREQSETYYHQRPRDSQIGAWVSEPQSGVVASREAMTAKFEQLTSEFEGKDIPLPEFWGGYELVAEKIEFWQGRANRMHDRIVYSLADGAWVMERLLP
ncbi:MULTISPECIES: pyridoxamine 5'-phosphate oxidase [unclassified Moraxella]|uniref:pyridoxamine 5'-phosphate oxidase n=1 Tax=unclassified Moraxella TaxID=2685852 RepID=UPI003AF61006